MRVKSFNWEVMGHGSKGGFAARLCMFLLFAFSAFVLVSCAPPEGAVAGGPMGPKEFMFGTIQFVIMAFIVYYFLVLSPARQKEDSHQQFLKDLKKNDEVCTSGGLFARVVAVRPEHITLEVATNVKIKVDPKHVLPVVTKSAADTSEKSTPKKK